MNLTMFSGLRRHLNQLNVKVSHKRKCIEHRKNLPNLPSRFDKVLSELREVGVSVTSLESINNPLTDMALKGLDRVFIQTDQLPQKNGDHAVHANQEMLEAEIDILKWGLDPDLLALVENYIGLPIAYRGLTARRDCVDGQLKGTRKWHRDDEDAAILKIIIYLNDVDMQSGPFQYISATDSPVEWKVRYEESSRVNDLEMSRLVPKSQWIPCTGPRGTVVIVDTCRVYHRGILPSLHDRKAAFFCYNSSAPLHPEWCKPMFNREFFIARASLNQLQISALDYSY
jgi:hypothetical protein